MKLSRLAATSRAWWTVVSALILVGYSFFSPNVTRALSIPTRAHVRARGSSEGDRSVMPEPIFVREPGPPVKTTHMAPAPASAKDGPEATPERLVVILVNQFRAQNNLPPLKLNPALTHAGQAHVTRESTARFFGHNDPDLGCNTADQRDAAAGYTHGTYFGENLAAGYSTPDSALTAWAGSPGHRANLLSPNYREIGVGYADDNDDTINVRMGITCPYTNTGGPFYHFWSQEFGAHYVNGLPSLPVIINGEDVTTTRRAVTLYVYGGEAGQPVWATQMRFSDDGKTWTNYEAWSPTHAYTLPVETGFKTVYAQLTDGTNTQTVSDTIYLIDNGPGTPILSPTSAPALTPTPPPVTPPAAATPTPAATPNTGNGNIPVAKVRVFLPMIRR